MTRTALLVVAKAPEPDRAKTRLAATVGSNAAADIAAASLLDTLRTVHDVPESAVFVAWTGQLDNAHRAREVSAALDGASVFPQLGEGLAARLAAAHAAVAERTTAPVLQIGMDTPQADSTLLAECAEPLHAQEGPDAVLGLADDGGWWVLGLRDPSNAEVLHSVPMSHPDTGKLTLKALRSAGLTVKLLPQLDDVDTAEDAVDVAAAIPRSDFAATVHARMGETT